MSHEERTEDPLRERFNEEMAFLDGLAAVYPPNINTDDLEESGKCAPELQVPFCGNQTIQLIFILPFTRKKSKNSSIIN